MKPIDPLNPDGPSAGEIEGSAPAARHFPVLDGLRGAAVIAVFFYHYGAGGTSANPILHGFGVLAKLGWAGVTLFFVLSGFLITGILWDSKGQQHWWRNFYIRRALPIFPLYYGSLLLVLLVALVHGGFKPTLEVLWIPAAFLQNFPHLIDLESRIHALPLFHYWSLAVEEQFYLLWPVLLIFATSSKHVARWCLSICGLSLGFRILMCMLTPRPEIYSSLLASRAGELALGGWLAMMYRSAHWHRLQRAVPLTAFLSAVVVLAVAWCEGSFQLEGSWQLTLGLLAVTVFLAAIVAGSLEPGPLQRVASVRWLRWVGEISFGIYIYHILFSQAYTAIASHLVNPRAGLVFVGVRWLVAAFCTVVISWVSFNFYEKPFLRLKVRFAPRVTGLWRART